MIKINSELPNCLLNKNEEINGAYNDYYILIIKKTIYEKFI